MDGLLKSQLVPMFSAMLCPAVTFCCCVNGCHWQCAETDPFGDPKSQSPKMLSPMSVISAARTAPGPQPSQQPPSFSKHASTSLEVMSLSPSDRAVASGGSGSLSPHAHFPNHQAFSSSRSGEGGVSRSESIALRPAVSMASSHGHGGGSGMSKSTGSTSTVKKSMSVAGDTTDTPDQGVFVGLGLGLPMSKQVRRQLAFQNVLFAAARGRLHSLSRCVCTLQLCSW